MAKNKWIAFAKKIDGISDWTGRLFAWLVIPLTVLIVFEVITRRFFGAPTIWTFELSNFYSGPTSCWWRPTGFCTSPMSASIFS